MIPPRTKGDTFLPALIAILLGTTYLGWVVAGWRGLVAGYLLGVLLAIWAR